MPIEIGHIDAIYRYPVKSMRGERLDVAALGWHGLDGDRRLALRRIEDRSGFPWLTATKVPELLLFDPYRAADAADAVLRTAGVYATVTRNGELRVGQSVHLSRSTSHDR